MVEETPPTTSYLQDDWKVKPNLTLNLGLRYYILAGAPQAGEKFNRISTFIAQVYDPSRAPTIIASTGALVPGTGDPLNGIITPFIQKGLDLPTSLLRTHYDTFGPRTGFAWSPRGNQKTVLRGGYGVFYFWDNNNHEGLDANPPFSDRSAFRITRSAILLRAPTFRPTWTPLTRTT